MCKRSGYIDGKQTPTYRIWDGMKNRCLNPNNKDYGRYGGRGISVCERWLEYENFLADMGERPPGLTIDRIDGNGNYTLTNCRWATRKEQRLNMADVHGIDHAALGITISALRARLARGWSRHEASTVSRTDKWKGRV